MSIEVRMRKSNDAAIRSVKEFIDSKPFSDKSIDELAQQAGISRNLLQKGFKARFGKTITEYIMEKKMEIAGAMLDEGKLFINEVAYKCGYAPSAFARAFKNTTGYTPTEWQNRDSNPQNKNGTA